MPIYTTPIFNIDLKKLIENYRILEKLKKEGIKYNE